MRCKYCGFAIWFNAKIRKWVTGKDHWKCYLDPNYPVRAHCPDAG